VVNEIREQKRRKVQGGERKGRGPWGAGTRKREKKGRSGRRGERGGKVSGVRGEQGEKWGEVEKGWGETRGTGEGVQSKYKRRQGRWWTGSKRKGRRMRREGERNGSHKGMGGGRE